MAYEPFISMVAPTVIVDAGFFGNTISWSHPQEQDIVQYTIERCCGQSDTTIMSGMNTYTDPIDGHWITSTYRVGATDQDQNSSLWSDEQAIENILFNDDLLIDSVSHDIAVLDIYVNNGSDIVDHRIYRSEDSLDYAAMEELATIPVDSFFNGVYSFTDSSVDEGTFYYYATRVGNLNNDLSSFNSGLEIITMLSPISGLETSILEDGNVYIEWVDDSDINDGYIISRKIPELFHWTYLDTLGPNDESYTHTEDIESGTTYLYSVQAYNLEGATSFSIIDTVTTAQLENTSYAVITGITNNEGTYSDTIKINYTSEDPNNGYAVTTDWQYSRNGTTWLDLVDSLILDNNFSPVGQNSIRWRTRAGENNLDHVEDPSVWLRMKLENTVGNRSS